MSPVVITGAPEPTYRVLLRVLFIDAGPTRSAWVQLEVRHDGRHGTMVPVGAGWHGMTDDKWLGALMETTWKRGGAVGLEYIDGGLYDRKRWRNLMETARVEGEIRRTARIRGADHALVPFTEMAARHRDAPRTLFCVPASSWRGFLCLRGGACNPEIAVVVNYLCGRTVEIKPGVLAKVIDLPGVNSENREHILDALGGAVTMASVILGLRLQIPDTVRAEQEAARQKHYGKSREKTALEKAGIDPARARSASGKPLAEARGVRKGRNVVAANTKARKSKAKPS